MNVVCAALRPTSGSVRVAGRSPLKDPRTYKRNIGYLPQQAPLYHELTVIEYLSFAAALREVPSRHVKTAVDRVIEQCGLGSGYAERIVGTLSGGYRQRVGLAQSIIHDPPLVILDEPTNGLDPVQMSHVRELVMNIGRERTVLVSTHILSEIELMNANVLLLRAGKLVFSGRVSDLTESFGVSPMIVKFHGGVKDIRTSHVPDAESIDFLDEHSIAIHFRNTPPRLRSLIDLLEEDGAVVIEAYKGNVTLEQAFKSIVTGTNVEVIE